MAIGTRTSVAADGRRRLAGRLPTSAAHRILPRCRLNFLAVDGTVDRIPTTALEVYEVVGAGDTVTAYLATAVAAGASAYEGAVGANFAAGVEVRKLGAATVSPEEIIEACGAHEAWSA